MVHRGRGCPRLTGPGAGRVIHDPMNGADLARYAPRPRDEALARAWGLSDRFVVGYVGAHGMAYGLANALEAADRRARCPRSSSGEASRAREGCRSSGRTGNCGSDTAVVAGKMEAAPAIATARVDCRSLF